MDVLMCFSVGLVMLIWMNLWTRSGLGGGWDRCMDRCHATSILDSYGHKIKGDKAPNLLLMAERKNTEQSTDGCSAPLT